MKNATLVSNATNAGSVSDADLRALLGRAKWSFSTRRVDRQQARRLDGAVQKAMVGDLILCEIEKVGQHARTQLAEGRYSEHYPGDLVVLACGARYAPDQFEGVAEIRPDGADMLAAGGIVGHMRRANGQMSKPTRLKPLGRLLDAANGALNVAQFAVRPKESARRIPTFIVVGSSMNAGKTTTAASFVHGLARAGYRVAGMKATGTGAFGDYNAFSDAGASIVADFTDFGLPSTYLQPLHKLEAIFKDMTAYAAQSEADVAVIEFADGVFQEETRRLLSSSVIQQANDGVLYAAADASGAILGVRELRDLGFKLLAVSGKVTISPLAMLEARNGAGASFVSREDLRSAATASGLLSGLGSLPEIGVSIRRGARRANAAAAA
ncbi:MAG: hypothetical protein AAF909_02710, partial [Pseudomonadota bacterium]